MTQEIKKHAHSQDQYPISLAESRQMVLDAAGFNPVEIGILLRRAVQKFVDKLDAKKTQFFSFEGQVTDSREVEDTMAQLKAAEDLAQLGIEVGNLKSRATSDKPAPPAVNIDLSGWTVTAPPTPKPDAVLLPLTKDTTDAD